MCLWWACVHNYYGFPLTNLLLFFFAFCSITDIAEPRQWLRNMQYIQLCWLSWCEQVRYGTILENGKVQTKNLAKHSGRAHKLAIEPGSPRIFYSCGEDGAVRHVSEALTLCFQQNIICFKILQLTLCSCNLCFGFALIYTVKVVLYQNLCLSSQITTKIFVSVALSSIRGVLLVFIVRWTYLV